MSEQNDNKPWYTNKDLFEQINELKQDMQETRTMIRKYNGLYDKVEEVKEDVTDVASDIAEIKAIQEGKSKVGEAIKSWGGWGIGILTFFFMLIKFYLGG